MTGLPFNLPSHWRYHVDDTLPGGLGLIRTDGEVVPFYRSTFDVLVSTGDFAHMRDQEKPLEKPPRYLITLDKSALSVSDEDLSRLAELVPHTYAPCIVTPIPDPAALIELLRQAEWSGTSIGLDFTYPSCPWCRAIQGENRSPAGHFPTCPVVPVLYPKEQA